MNNHGELVTLESRYQSLIESLRSYERVAVAFSGGVDSSFLCLAAAQAMGARAIAITVRSAMFPKRELDCAIEIARQVEIAHVIVDDRTLDEVVAANPGDRCYHCKKIEFGKIVDAAAARGVTTVLDGSNLDDLNDYRPGLRALAELQIASPLRDARLTKADIRELSRRFGLPTWDKPAFACLASRIPYGERIDPEKLARIERAEEALVSFGFRQFRVRSHEDIARIEVAPDERPLFFDVERLDEIARSIKACGFAYAAFELEGYRVGSMNRTIGSKP